ncbi:MAG: arylsulfatase [Planctomycetota bacterium]
MRRPHVLSLAATTLAGHVLAIGLAALAVSETAAAQTAAGQTAAKPTTSSRKPPNVVIIYADDLGYGDLSCYNPEAAYQTPRLDQMAREGVRFTDAHSPSTICSPSRYGLLSGQQIYRSTGRGGGAFEGPGGPSYLKPGTLTLGDMLKAKGYRTGVFGKWHVGLTWLDKNGKRLGGGFDNSLLIDYEKSTPLIDGPNARGFDESFVTPNCPTTDPLYIYIENGMVPVPASKRHKRKTLPNPGGKWRWDNDEGWMAEGYRFVDADLLFFDKAKSFVEEHRKNTPEQPFFVLLSTQICHAPVLPAPGFEGATEAGARGDFVRQLDTLVGRVFDLLQKLDVDDNTLVLFHSDNGPETLHTAWMRKDHNHDAAGGWRGVKRDGWEGGHRVPLLAWWPKAFPAGLVSAQMANTTDIFATLASAVGFQLPDEQARDSFDLLPAMLGTQDTDQSIRPHLLTQSFRGEFQLRVGNWKYLEHKGSGGNRYDRGLLQQYALPEAEPEAAGQLYNLTTDPGETTNLFFQDEERRRDMQALLTELKKSGRSAPRGRKPLGMAGIAAAMAARETSTEGRKTDGR